MNPLKALNEYGQSVCLDYFRRGLIISGELQRMVEEDGLSGVTENPSIFEKVIIGSTDYAGALKVLQNQKDLDPMGIYEHIAIRDIQDAADVLRPTYDKTNKRDGYASLDVSPYIAHNTQSTIEEARRLWRGIGRENAMIKVPATPEGIPAIEQLTSEGINVNITLVFGLDVYERVALAYIAGLEKLAVQGGDLNKIASVASFFVSRIDTAVDGILASRFKSARKRSGTTAKYHG
jgi:transaldolase